MTVCLINISFIDRLLSQGRAVFFCLGIKKNNKLIREQSASGQRKKQASYTDFLYLRWKSKESSSESINTGNFSSLSKKKKYYVQVRTYKTVSKVNYYSSWSGKKTVVTK